MLRVKCTKCPVFTVSIRSAAFFPIAEEALTLAHE